MSSSLPQSGYTLPVFACAATVAAVQTIKQRCAPQSVVLSLLEPDITVTIPIEQSACFSENCALAITRSDPGDNVDITRFTPIWALVESLPGTGQVCIEGGEGIGKLKSQGSKAAIYGYAQRLIKHHLRPLITKDRDWKISIILPEGRALAKRTSNAAFGVVEGLSLLGTTGISQPLSAPAQLEQFQTHLQTLANQSPHIIFCIGENGLDLARQWGASETVLVKTANWLGSMLATAAMAGIESILLVGYHGKLIKLAGGIFHTHHHLADARLEILTAVAVQTGLPLPLIHSLSQAESTDSALTFLRQQSPSGEDWINPLYEKIASRIDSRSERYIYQLTEKRLKIGSLLFDGARRPIVVSRQGKILCQQQGMTLPDRK